VKTVIVVMLGLLLCSVCAKSASQATLQDDIVRKTQELFDAVAAGNKQPWEAYVADDVMYFDEQGHNMDKKALIATIAPLPSGLGGAIKIVNSKLNVQGNTLIHSYDMNETENVHGQELHARYHATDTWMNRNGQWQIVAAQVLRYYEDPAAGVADTRKFQDYAGSYELAGEREVVSSEDGKLYLTRGTRPPVELIPEACDVFFRKGIEGRAIFHYSDGRVDSLVHRRNNEDIVWQKVK
jgi:ketosteroid isomerase-like protein